MRTFLVKWFVLTVAVLAASYIVPGIVISGPMVAVIAALILGLVNAFVRPVLVLLTFPLTVITLGLFLLVLNALLLYVVASMIDGFFVVNFWSALIGSIFISILSAMINLLIKSRR